MAVIKTHCPHNDDPAQVLAPVMLPIMRLKTSVVKILSLVTLVHKSETKFHFGIPSLLAARSSSKDSEATEIILFICVYEIESLNTFQVIRF